MKKRFLAVLLTLPLLAGGCGAKEQTVPAAMPDDTSSTVSVESVTEDAVDSGMNPTELLDLLWKKQGSVYNIYTYDMKLISVMKQYLPEYKTEEEMTISGADEVEEADSAAESTTVSAPQSETASSVSEPQTALTDQKPDTGADDDPTLPEVPVSEETVTEDKDGVKLIKGQIGDILIRWHVIEDDLNRYQDVLDEALMDDALPEDEKVDLFLVDGDLAAKYCDVDADVAKPLKKLGISERELSSQYEFTKQLVCDEEGVQRGTTWQVPCGLFVYRRSIAREVLGTDNPVQVQKEVSSWEQFESLAGRLLEHNYKMLSGYTDTFYAFAGQKEKSWVNDNDQIQLDESLKQWVDMTKRFTEQGYNNGSDGFYSEAWQKDQKAGSPVFGFFLSSWDVSHYLLPDSLEQSVSDGGTLSAGNGNFGDWAVCQGPSAFYHGGSWLCAASTSDNDELSAEIMRNLTCDAAVLKKMAADTGELTNHMDAMSEVIAEEMPMRAFFDGQDYLRVFEKAARDLDLSRAGYYDSGMNRALIQSFLPYFKGEIGEEDAYALFYRKVMEQYPFLAGA